MDSQQHDAKRFDYIIKGKFWKHIGKFSFYLSAAKHSKVSFIIDFCQDCILYLNDCIHNIYLRKYLLKLKNMNCEVTMIWFEFDAPGMWVWNKLDSCFVYSCWKYFMWHQNYSKLNCHEFWYCFKSSSSQKNLQYGKYYLKLIPLYMLEILLNNKL